MAVKQNNTEGNGGTSPGSGAAGAAGKNSKLNVKNLNSGAGDDTSDIMDDQLPGCSGASLPVNSAEVGVAGDTNMHTDVSGSNFNNEIYKDLSKILKIMTMMDLKSTIAPTKYHFYLELIVQLAKVPVPRNQDDLVRFKKDILAIGEFLKREPEEFAYPVYTNIICKIMTESKESPTGAIAIVFDIFTPSQIVATVKKLLEMNTPAHCIQKTVSLLCEWMVMCSFCQRLAFWVETIMRTLLDKLNFGLFESIALENVEGLLRLFIVPIIRPRVSSILFLMLGALDHSPSIFHKIVPRLPRILKALRQQMESKGENAVDTRKAAQELVRILKTLLIRHYGYEKMYKPVIEALKEFPFDMEEDPLDQTGDFNTALVLRRNAKVGLVNLGNTCYMNSVLQALASTKQFSREILLTKTKSSLLISVQQQISLMLFSRRFELTPARVFEIARPPGFERGLQQDSSEFLSYMLETMHDHESRYREPQPRVQKSMPVIMVNGEEEEDEEMSDGTTDRHAAGAEASALMPVQQANSAVAHNSADVKRSTIERTFTGKLATTYKCLTCGWKSRNVDSFRDLQLSFPDLENDCASNYSVQDMIEYYCSSEKLFGDNQYFCEKCKKLSDAERFINVIDAPKNLILTLKHFKYDQKYQTRAKLLHKVFHDEKVSVKVCDADSLQEMATVHYDLYAGVVHSGFSMDSGHYYTYAADTANQWYKFNDDVVTPATLEELHNLEPPNTPYILFYQMSSVEECGDALSPSRVVNVDPQLPLTLEELPCELRDYVNVDNNAFSEELARKARLEKIEQRKNYRYENNDEDPRPPPPSGCGGNAFEGMGRFVY